jgi:hypothetical protein
MTDNLDFDRPTSSRGCLAAGLGAVLLGVLSPFVVAVRGWRKWRRGAEIRTTVVAERLTNAAGAELRRIDFTIDVPQPAEPGFRRRLTDSLVRVAEELRAPDDVYHLIYRLPWDEETVALPVGPKLQEFGDRFALVQSQGTMAGRTAVWLTLGRDDSLSKVVDPVAYSPEAEGEPEGLMTHPSLRWSMATEWARVGPSLVFRLILIVPPSAEDRVTTLLGSVSS